MKLKYILYGQGKNKVMTVLIAFQMVIVLVLMVSIISAIVSRYEKYKPLERFFQGDGLNMYLEILLGRNGERYLPFIESSDAENYLKKAHIASTYSVQMTFDIGNVKEETGGCSPVTAYDDELVAAYTPEMKAGRWLRTADADTDMIEIVLAQNEEYYKVGDIITLTTSDVVKEEAGHRLQVPIQAKVVGILADNASVLRYTFLQAGEYVDFRDYYTPISREVEDRAFVFVTKRDIEHNNKVYAKQQKDLLDKERVWQYTMSGACFIQYDEGITQEEKDYNSKYLAINGRYDFRHSSAEMRESSMEYIMGQMDMLLPILAALVILTLMSIISNTVIMIRQNMHDYSVYYMMGLTWRQCVAVHGRSIILMQAGTFLFTMLCIVLCEKTGALKGTFFSVGGWQLLGCAAVILLFIVFSIVLSFLLIGKKSAKDILREVE